MNGCGLLDKCILITLTVLLTAGLAFIFWPNGLLSQVRLLNFVEMPR